MFVDAPILIWLNSKTLEVLEFSNGTFFDYIEKNKNKNSRIIPKISSREAVQRTLDYLKALNIEVPHNYQLNDISYNTTSSERWYIRWELANNNVTLDVGDGSTPFAFTTILDEDYGLSLVSLPIALPSIPQQVEQLSREEAILKAFDCVPYVIDTSYFKQFRGEGYGMQSLLGIKKCYNMPNWMLDPKRSTYLNKDDPPHEIRLCWKVDIVTSDITPKIAEGKKSARYPVVVSVYLDITTGDCVGAIFK